MKISLLGFIASMICSGACGMIVAFAIVIVKSGRHMRKLEKNNIYRRTEDV